MRDMLQRTRPMVQYARTWIYVHIYVSLYCTVLYCVDRDLHLYVYKYAHVYLHPYPEERATGGPVRSRTQPHGGARARNRTVAHAHATARWRTRTQPHGGARARNRTVAHAHATARWRNRTVAHAHSYKAWAVLGFAVWFERLYIDVDLLDYVYIRRMQVHV